MEPSSDDCPSSSRFSTPPIKDQKETPRLHPPWLFQASCAPSSVQVEKGSPKLLGEQGKQFGYGKHLGWLKHLSKSTVEISRYMNV